MGIRIMVCGKLDLSTGSTGRNCGPLWGNNDEHASSPSPHMGNHGGGILTTGLGRNGAVHPGESSGHYWRGGGAF